jgi:hypothetical protein
VNIEADLFSEKRHSPVTKAFLQCHCTTGYKTTLTWVLFGRFLIITCIDYKSVKENAEIMLTDNCCERRADEMHLMLEAPSSLEKEMRQKEEVKKKKNVEKRNKHNYETKVQTERKSGRANSKMSQLFFLVDFANESKKLDSGFSRIVVEEFCDVCFFREKY